MTLRTARRRISPRTKRRYRAIKDFLRRALGTTSQPDTKTNSNISVSVSDLKRKIIGIEKQLNQVSQHCFELISVDNSSRCSSSHITQCNGHCQKNYRNSESNVSSPETKILYKIENQCKHTNESDIGSRGTSSNSNDTKNVTKYENKKIHNAITEIRNKKKNPKYNSQLEVLNEIDSISSRRKNQSKYKKEISYPTGGYHSSDEVIKKEYPVRGRDKKYSKVEYLNPDVFKESKLNKGKENERIANIEYLLKKYEGRNKKQKCKQHKREIGQAFIADIIKRQYKPVQLFNRRVSNLSQLSAPVCRDTDLSIHDTLQDGSELCSCCFEEDPCRNAVGYRRKSDFSDMRSICDARLYSSKRHSHYKQIRRNPDYYNDSLYDLVPVKEKSSPKSRKKFVEDNFDTYDHYKEVPPSPRSLRPRLNLRAQSYEDTDDEFYASRPNRRTIPIRTSPVQEKCDKNVQDDGIFLENITPASHNLLQNMKSLENSNSTENNEDIDSNLPYQNFPRDRTNLTINDTSLNKTQETDLSIDRTDKALYEIKDILQSFLEEMKREAIHSEKSSASNNKFIGTRDGLKQDNDVRTCTSVIPNSIHSFNYTAGQCSASPLVPGFPNACCYPLVPMCPINCVQNGLVLPSKSYTCTACVNSPKDVDLSEKEVTKINNNNEKEKANKETEELIKEIYNYLRRSPITERKKECRDVSVDNLETTDTHAIQNKIKTRSTGGCSKVSLHDVNVGTSKMNCYSRSCEILASQKTTRDTVYSDPPYSDTILKNLSLEAAASHPSNFDFDSLLDMKVKPSKPRKLSKVLQSFGGLLKKKKRDVIEELSESESATEIDMRSKSPYRQHLTNYMMHAQEYYQPLPSPPRQPYKPISHDYPYNPVRAPEYKRRHAIQPPMSHSYNPYPYVMPEQTTRHGSQFQYTSPSYSTTYDPHYNQLRPQVPLCLKEIEVKSIGTQSDNKQSFFKCLKRTFTVPKKESESSDEVQQSPQIRKTGFLNWKNLDEKALQTNSDNINITYKNTTRKLTETDNNIRNAMIRKYFRKRNPFSRNNQLLKILLGKDEPPEPITVFRPRILL